MKSNRPTGMLFVGAIAAILAGTSRADPPYWHREIVDAGGRGCGQWCSLGFDPNGRPAIVYVDEDDALAYAWRDDTGPTPVWVKEIIPDEYHLARCSLAFHPDGYPAVTYCYWDPIDPNDPNDCDKWSFRYAQRPGDTWQFSARVHPWLDLSLWPILHPVGRGQLAFEAEGSPWVLSNISSIQSGAGVCATPLGSPGGDWAYGFIDTAEGPCGDHIGRLSLALGPTGLPAAAYRHTDCKLEPYSGLRYAEYDGAPLDPNYDWPHEDVLPDPCGSSDYRYHAPSLAFAPDDTPAIAFAGKGADDVWRVTFGQRTAGVGWSFRHVTDQLGAIGELLPPDLCLAYRVDGNPGISFYDNRDALSRPLMYAWLDPNDPNDPNGVWQVRAVDWIGNNGSYHSLASDPNGMPAVAYYDDTDGRLIYAVTSAVPDTYTLILGTTQGGGTVEADPGVDPNWDAYVYGTWVALVATPDDNRKFSRWLIYDPNHPGDANYADQDSNNPAYVVMDRDRQVDAVFVCSSGGGLGIPLVVATAGLVLLKLCVGLRLRRRGGQQV